MSRSSSLDASVVNARTIRRPQLPLLPLSLRPLAFHSSFRPFVVTVRHVRNVFRAQYRPTGVCCCRVVFVLRKNTRTILRRIRAQTSVVNYFSSRYDVSAICACRTGSGWSIWRRFLCRVNIVYKYNIIKTVKSDRNNSLGGFRRCIDFSNT